MGKFQSIDLHLPYFVLIVPVQMRMQKYRIL